MGGWPGWVKLAEIVVCPAAAPLTNPVLLIVAKVGAEDDQLTWFVRSTVLPSLKVPVAVNCKVAPPSRLLRRVCLSERTQQLRSVPAKLCFDKIGWSTPSRPSAEPSLF